MYKKGLTLSPKNFELFNGMGFILQKMGRLDEAEESYVKCLEVNPRSTRCLRNYGNLLKDKNNEEKAL